MAQYDTKDETHQSASEYAFLNALHDTLEAAVNGLQNEDYSDTEYHVDPENVEGYTTRDWDGENLLHPYDSSEDDLHPVEHNYHDTLTRAILAHPRYTAHRNCDPDNIDPEEMTYALYRKAQDATDPVLAEVTFKEGAGGELIPYNGIFFGSPPAVEYRVNAGDDPYFVVSAGDLTIDDDPSSVVSVEEPDIQYDSTKKYLANLGMTLHKATGIPVDLPDTVEDEIDVDLHGVDTAYSVDNVQGTSQTVSADDD